MAAIETSAPERTPDIFILCRGVLWRPWLVLGITLAGSLGAALIAWSLLPVYKSTARILVESQQIPDDLARPSVIASAGERLAVIEQRLLTHDNLLNVSDRLGLFGGQEDLTPLQRVRILRESTSVEGIPITSNPRHRGPSHVSAFTISFRTDDPHLAAQVTNAYVAGILERNRAARTARAGETLAFFNSEVARIAADLDGTEDQIAAFKANNRAYLPDTVPPRLKELSGLRKQWSHHAARIAQVTGKDAAIAPRPVRLDLPANDTARADRTAVQFTDAPVGNRSRKQGQIDLLLARQRMTETRMSQVQQAIERSAQVEVELRSMERRFDHLQMMHREAVLKQSDAARGEKLEDRHQVERFEVLETAQVPEKPISPKRLSIATGGALASLSLGLVLAAFLEWYSRIIRNSADLYRLLGVRPVIVMPPIQTRRERSERRNRLLLPLLGSASFLMIVVWLAGDPIGWFDSLIRFWNAEVRRLVLLAQTLRIN